MWLTAPTPSVLSEWVQARERDPSMELALVREAVLERARRVILAEGTVGVKKRRTSTRGEALRIADMRGDHAFWEILIKMSPFCYG